MPEYQWHINGRPESLYSDLDLFNLYFFIIFSDIFNFLSKLLYKNPIQDLASHIFVVINYQHPFNYPYYEFMDASSCFNIFNLIKPSYIMHIDCMEFQLNFNCSNAGIICSLTEYHYFMAQDSKTLLIIDHLSCRYILAIY